MRITPSRRVVGVATAVATVVGAVALIAYEQVMYAVDRAVATIAR